ncbi:hypothetical protein, partial [Terribacillus sp. AE2B 122]|jgi:hypothetical protein
VKDIYFSLMLSWNEPFKKVVHDTADSYLVGYGEVKEGVT